MFALSSAAQQLLSTVTTMVGKSRREKGGCSSVRTDGCETDCSSLLGQPVDLGKMRSDAERIFRAGVGSVAPNQLVKSAVTREGDTLVVTATGRRYPMARNVRVLAFGKAVLGMVTELEALIRDHVVDGVASKINFTMA
jgi:hypothetical protein